MLRRLLLAALALACALIAAAPAAAALPYADGPTNRELLGGQWLFRMDPNDEGLAAGWAADPAADAWSAVTIPNAWNGQDLSEAGMAGGVGWYRRDFKLRAGSATTAWVARFESVNYRATVFLNGTEIGAHEGASVPFEVILPRELLAADNRLVVRVDSRRVFTDLPPGPNGGGWWNYGGILREVYLRRIDQVDIEELKVEPDLPCRTCDATLLIEATLRNHTSNARRAVVEATVAGRTVRLGSEPVPRGRTRRVSERIRIENPQLWEPGRGRLYPVSVVASVKGRNVARWNLKTGIRSIEVRGGRLYINGRTWALRGASIHEDHPELGAALGVKERTQHMSWLRQLRATITRAHYPLHPHYLELADRYGILVWDQIPVYQMRDVALRHAHTRERGYAYLTETIKRDRNHPSVLAWSIGNELAPNPQRGQVRWLYRAAKLAKELDRTRLVAYDVAGYPTQATQAAYQHLDALGVNSYFGWYPGPTAQLVNRAALGQYLDRLRRFYPRHALFITEFGAEANRRGPASEKGTYAFQDEFMRYHLRTYDSKRWLGGAIAWILQDFKVRPGWEGGNPEPSPPYNKKGLVDERGNRKPAFSVTRRLFAGAR